MGQGRAAEGSEGEAWVEPSTAEQPAPQGGGPEVWPSVIEQVPKILWGPSWQPVRETLGRHMRSRDAMGRERYGTALRAGNGRAPLVDAYQEALDACVYLRQAWLEAQDDKAKRAVHRRFVDAMRLAGSLCRLMLDAKDDGAATSR